MHLHSMQVGSLPTDCDGKTAHLNALNEGLTAVAQLLEQAAAAEHQS